MKKLIVVIAAGLLMSVAAQAEDHVMAATKPSPARLEPASLTLSLSEAQDYALKQNRSLKNASLAVQEAYAQRWQTIAAMLPQLDGGYTYSNYCGYSAELSMMGNAVKIDMPNVGALTLTASVGVNGQGIVGVLLNNIAIDMRKIALEQSELELSGSVMTGYVSALALQSITGLLDSSLVNLMGLEQMTRRSVEVGAAEQTTADQIHVRVNTMRNSINAQQRNVELALAALKVLLDVPVETELVLTDRLEDLLSPDAVLTLLGQEFNINNNLNYQLLAKQTDLAEKNVHMAGWAYGPTLSLAYNYTDQQYYGEGGMRMTPPNLVQVSVRMPLWSSAKRAAGVVEKKIAYEEAKNTLSEAKDNLAIQYRQLCFTLNNNYESYLNAKESMDVSERVFRSASDKFRWGTNSNLELINASNDLITAQSSYIQAILSLVEAQVSLRNFLNN